MPKNLDSFFLFLAAPNDTIARSTRLLSERESLPLQTELQRSNTDYTSELKSLRYQHNTPTL